jgi:hypothetical protein
MRVCTNCIEAVHIGKVFCILSHNVIEGILIKFTNSCLIVAACKVGQFYIMVCCRSAQQEKQGMSHP